MVVSYTPADFLSHSGFGFSQVISLECIVSSISKSKTLSVFATNFKEIGDYLTKKLKCVGSLIDLSGFDEAFCKKTFIEQLKKVPVEVLNSKVCLKSISMLLVYLKETQKQGILLYTWKVEKNQDI